MSNLPSLPRHARVVVVGGGVIGTSTAYHLALMGWKDIVLLERHPIRSGRQVLTFVTDRKPTYAGIDPYNYYIDRNSTDNVLAVR